MLENISNKLEIFSEEIFVIISKEVLGKKFAKKKIKEVPFQKLM